MPLKLWPPLAPDPRMAELNAAISEEQQIIWRSRATIKCLEESLDKQRELTKRRANTIKTLQAKVANRDARIAALEELLEEARLDSLGESER